MTAPWDADPGPDDDVIEGQSSRSRARPGSRASAAQGRPAARRAAPDHPRAPGQRGRDPQGGPVAGAPGPAHQPVSPGPGAQAAAAGGGVGGGRRAAPRGGARRVGVRHRAGVPARPDDRGRGYPHVPAGAQGGQGDPAVPGAGPDRRERGGDRRGRRRHRAVPAGLAGRSARWSCRSWRPRAGRTTVPSSTRPSCRRHTSR